MYCYVFELAISPYSFLVATSYSCFITTELSRSPVTGDF